MFLLNPSSKIPIYTQIKEQIQKFIESGVLKEGDKLPSVRSLAMDNMINPNTVSRAYQELEKEGYVHNIPKKGTYIAMSRENSRTNQIQAALESLKNSGIGKEEVIAAVEELWKEDTDA